MASNPQRQGVVPENEEEKKDALFSPRFKSVAEMAGWDEEALLIASLIVEDTPDRNLKQNKRLNFPYIKSPLTNSRRKRRAQRRSPSTSMPVSLLKLDDDPPANEETSKGATKLEITKKEVKKTGELDCIKLEITENEVKKTGELECISEGSLVSSSNSVIPCIDKLREELSCAICLEICFEPSTTPCGHSFCKRCLRSAADKCGKRCPKCRQLISNGRSCTVNTVLWNTIQLLFPREIEARKAACGVPLNCQRQSSAEVKQNSLQNGSVGALPESVNHSPNRRSRHNMRRRSGAQPSDSVSISRGDDVMRRSNNLPSPDTDELLALRLQREEFMGVTSNRRSDDAPVPPRSSLALARANLRAMATRATSIPHRGRIT